MNTVKIQKTSEHEWTISAVDEEGNVFDEIKESVESFAWFEAGKMAANCDASHAEFVESEHSLCPMCRRVKP